MADTFTANYGWTKPAVGGDPDTWGGLLNTDLDNIDSTVFSVSGVANAAMPKAGGTFTGNVVLAPTSGSALLSLQAAAGNNRSVSMYTGTSARWSTYADSSTESGSNAGSSYVITRYSDAGAAIDSPVVISRATGQTTFSTRPNFNGQTPWDSGNFTPANYAALAGGPIFTNGLFCINTGTGENDFQLGRGGISKWWLAVTTADAFLVIRTNPSTGAFAETVMNVPQSGNIAFSRTCQGPDFVATSDERLKTGIVDFSGGYEELKHVRIKEYDKYTPEGELVGHEVGPIAQQLRDILPSAVAEGADGFLTVSDRQLLALAVNAIQDLGRAMELAGIL